MSRRRESFERRDFTGPVILASLAVVEVVWFVVIGALVLAPVLAFVGSLR